MLMAPTASMLFLCHHGKTHNHPSVSAQPQQRSTSATKKWWAVQLVNQILKAGGSDNTNTSSHTQRLVLNSDLGKRFEDALQLCSC
ncbi:hypothetical protein QN277_020065 [Acacia crassicarpa]|uniref:Uncharacterized protein n=1 Tax=Acacia crassicarpa TaxID=499986 RepID=A0AAE1MSC5_9FABA|nr:hypothetical protein QN277_020065 [Acacia crassicarpa]